jgi:GxxExxY protein
MHENEITKEIIGGAIEVHRILGPGLLESAYQECLVREFLLRNLHFNTEVVVPIVYKGVRLQCGYRLDFLVEDKVIVELKSVAIVPSVALKQLLTYLRLMDKKVGLLINFNEEVLHKGIHRVVNGLSEPLMTMD